MVTRNFEREGIDHSQTFGILKGDGCNPYNGVAEWKSSHGVKWRDSKKI